MERNDARKHIKVVFKKFEYEIEKAKIAFVLQRLENKRNLKLKTNKDMLKLMEKYELFDEIFLKGLSK